MTWAILAVILLCLGAFSLVAFLLLRFTTSPGLHIWTFCATVLLSFVALFGYVWVIDWFLAPFERRGTVVSAALIAGALIAPPTAMWALLRYVSAVRERIRRIWWLIGPCTVLVAVYAGLGLVNISQETLDMGYQNRSDWKESLAATICRKNKWVILRAEADHFVNPIGPSRPIHLIDALPTASGDVYLRFGSIRFSSSSDFHFRVVYCYSPRQHRLVWKALEGDSS